MRNAAFKRCGVILVTVLSMHLMLQILIAFSSSLPPPHDGVATLRERWGKGEAKGAFAEGNHRVHKNAPPPHNGTGLIVTVILIGHSRPAGLLSSLASVQAAVVPAGMTVHLHICVDGNDTAVGAVARGDHDWAEAGRGELTYVQRGASFGLAKHITLCWEDPQAEEWALFLEDDVVIATDAFVAFQEAVHIRDNSPMEGNITGVALHDQRVNQFCWGGDVEKMQCPAIARLCTSSAKGMISDTVSAAGAFKC